MHQRNSPRTTQHWSKSHVTRASRFCRDQCCNSMSHTKGKWLWSTRVQMMSRSSIKCCRTIGILRQREGNWEEQRDPCSLSLITSNDSRQCVCKTSSSIVLLPWRQTCQVTKWSILCFEQIDQWFTYKQHIKAVDFVVHGHFFRIEQSMSREAVFDIEVNSLIAIISIRITTGKKASKKTWCKWFSFHRTSVQTLRAIHRLETTTAVSWGISLCRQIVMQVYEQYRKM